MNMGFVGGTHPSLFLYIPHTESSTHLQLSISFIDQIQTILKKSLYCISLHLPPGHKSSPSSFSTVRMKTETINIYIYMAVCYDIKYIDPKNRISTYTIYSKAINCLYFRKLDMGSYRGLHEHSLQIQLPFLMLVVGGQKNRLLFSPGTGHRLSAHLKE